MPDSMESTRCLSRCQILPDVWKRCIRSFHHAESHIWVEALNRTDGLPIIVFWDDEVAKEPRDIRLMISTKED